MQTKHLCVLIQIWTKGEAGAPLNRFKPSSKPWPFQGGASFVDYLCYFCHVLLCFHARLFFIPCGHLLGTSWPLGSPLWCLTVSLSLSHWYPWSGVVLDCIESWSLPSFLVLFFVNIHECLLLANFNPSRKYDVIYKQGCTGFLQCTLIADILFIGWSLSAT